MAQTVKLLWPEYEYKIPAVPQKETDILYHKNKKGSQYWRKQLMPTAMEWTRMNATERFLFIERERERWVNGVWFFNNGEPTWITGKHYDHLTYQTFDYEPRYLDSQRHDWYFRDLVKEDPTCYGGLKIKPRRYGATDEEVTDSQYEAISGFSRKIGMMSENRDKVYATIYDKITTSYMSRPAFIRPEIFMRNGQIPVKKMQWKPNKVQLKGVGDMVTFDMTTALKSLIEPKSTTVMGYDGWKLHKLILDEIWKWTACSPSACWDKQKECLVDGGLIIGYAMLLSTMGDDESYEQAIKDGIAMWGKSNPFERDDNGYTETGLYRYFISGHYALRRFADKHGFINLDEADNYIMNGRKKYVEGSQEWLFAVRRYPRTIEECLGNVLSSGLFDSKRLQERITIINKTPKLYTENTLEIDNMDVVHLQPDKNGPWIIQTPPNKNSATKQNNNRYKKSNGIWLPLPNPEGVGGYDPVRYADIDVVSKSVSQASIIGRYKFDYYGRGVANKYIGLYLDRPEDPEDGHYEFFKFLKLYNLMGMYERQVESVIRRFRELKAQHMLLKNPKDGVYGMWTDGQRKVIKHGVDKFQEYIQKPKSIEQPDRLQDISLIPLLEQAKELDPMKTTKSDVFMSNVMLEHGMPLIKESQFGSDYDPDAAYRKILAQLFPKRNNK